MTVWEEYGITLEEYAKAFNGEMEMGLIVEGPRIAIINVDEDFLGNGCCINSQK